MRLKECEWPVCFPSLDLLRGFEAAARQLSFTKAAAELFLTQSAVSRQVQTLEEQLGTPLFERQHRQIRLTPAGQKLYRAAGGCDAPAHRSGQRDPLGARHRR